MRRYCLPMTPGSGMFDSSAPGLRRRRPIAALIVSLAVLTGLVESGALTRIDQYAVYHLMPGLDVRHQGKDSLGGLFVPYSGRLEWWDKILELWTYPCSVLISALVIGTVAGVLWRRSRRPAAVVVVAAWAAGNGIEVVGKGIIRRSDLYGLAGGERIHVVAFDNSFPSGHSLRCVLVVCAVTLAWRRALPWLLAWAALVPVFLVMQSAHVPTDVLGGLLISLVVVLLAATWIEIGERLPGRASLQREPVQRSSPRGCAGRAAGTTRGG